MSGDRPDALSRGRLMASHRVRSGRVLRGPISGTPDDGRIGRRTLLGHGLAAVWMLLAARAAPAAPPAPPPPPGSPPDKSAPSGVTVSPDDTGITASAVEYPGVVGPLLGYLAVPRAPEFYPGVLLLHDLQGLTEHFKDIARRLAKVGYVALAPDLVSRAGGTDKLGDPAKVATALQTTSPGQVFQDLGTSVRFLEARPLVSKTRIGALGFGAGGSLVWLAVSGNADIKAVVSVSGTVPSDRAVQSINAAVLSIYGENDRRDTEAISDFEAAMKKAGLAFTLKVEPKAGHDFFNDTTPRYVPAAAKDAWTMTLDWFASHLKG